MSESAVAYLLLAVYFFCVDMIAGEVANVRPRPFAAALLAAVWPLSAAFAIIGSALIIRKLRNRCEGLDDPAAT